MIPKSANKIVWLVTIAFIAIIWRYFQPSIIANVDGLWRGRRRWQ